MAQILRLLVVEDDPAVRALLVAYLEKDNYRVDGVSTALEAEKCLQGYEYAMVLLDLGLPDEDGLVLARKLRTKSAVPIVFVTERSADAEKIAALEMGGDDYITKPFNPRELSARIRNILSRAGGHEGSATTVDRFAFHDWWLDVGKRTVEDSEGKALSITRAEFDVLRSLLFANGRILSRDALLDAVGSKNDDVSDRTIDVLVSRLRKKIEPDLKSPTIIVTVPGVGYRLGVPISQNR